MTFNFRGVDLASPEQWEDFTTVLEHQLTFSHPDLGDVDDRELIRDFADANTDGARRLVLHIAGHESPKVREHAAFMAVDLLDHDENFATGVIVEGLSDVNRLSHGRLLAFIGKVLEGHESMQALTEVRLPNLARIIRAYKDAKADQ